MSGWKEVVVLTEIPVLGARVYESGDQSIAIFRAKDDAVFAIDNTCPHQSGTLSEGIVHGYKVTCPLHNWVISLEDGQAQGADEGKTACFETKVEDGMVYLKL